MESPSPPPKQDSSFTRGETGYYVGFGLLTLFLASLPYLYGVFTTPPGHVYTGLTCNIDDVAVYLSWFRQALSGEFFQRNLFNTETQRGLQFSVFSLLFGNLARLTGIPLPAIHHIARLLCGGLFLWAIVRFLGETISDKRARRIAFALVCVSSGFGWVMGGFDPAKGFSGQPIDLWQPEAISFLSLYFAPLFTAALSLMVVFITSVLRSERTNRTVDIVPAAVAGLLLANFHTYDVVHLFAVAGTFRFVSDAVSRRFNLQGWLRLLLVVIVTLPSFAYTYYALLLDPLFRQRDVKTTTAPLQWVLLGLGIPLLLGVVAMAKPDFKRFQNVASWRLLTVWSVVAIVIAYIPVDFQRKLLMGAHIPLCLLAGVALTNLTSRLTGDFPKIAASVVIAVSGVSNVVFLLQDVGRLSLNVGSTENRPYLTQAEWDALTFLRDKTDHSGGVLVCPDPTSHQRFPNFPLKPYLGVFLPGFTGHSVYNGHWSETAAYVSKWTNANRFFRQETPDEFRQKLLAEHQIRYVLYANALAKGTPTQSDGTPISDMDGVYLPVNLLGDSSLKYLKEVYRNSEITLYEVVSTAPTAQ